MPQFPRELTGEERGALDFLLAADFPGVAELREQATATVVTGKCDCGCPTIDLSVDRDRARRAPLSERVPVESVASDETIWLLLFVQDGWLEMLELAWITDDPPEAFPPVESFAPPTTRS